MHSFNDFHDLNDAGRTSFPDNNNNTANVPSANREAATLILPVTLKCNSILSIPPTIDPSVLRPTPQLGDVAQLSAFLPVAGVPLILADTGRQLGGSSDFQSNFALPAHTHERTSDASLRKANGLGLHLSENIKDSKPEDATRSAVHSRMESLDGLFSDMHGFPSDCFSGTEPFYDEFRGLRSMASALVHGDILADENLLCGKDSQIPPSTSCSLGSLEYPLAASSSSSRGSLDTSHSSKGSSDFTGLVADINMFDKDCNGGICVRPRDLTGYNEDREAEEPSSPSGVKIEETIGESLAPSNPATPKYLNVPQADWPQIPTEHLPFIIEQYLAQFGTGAETSTNTVPSTLIEVPAPPYTPITAEILEAVEDAHSTPDSKKQRNKLGDKTNTASRLGANVMGMHESLIPQDVDLDKPYEGVAIITVVQKTRYFWMMHPGERLSEELLFSFAGRLNRSGQQIPGYRCYVEGCSKTTKRKDHMADHVRTHLGEKPFQCSVWWVATRRSSIFTADFAIRSGMGFIRNNDCQRHENNHRPDKKFVCPW